MANLKPNVSTQPSFLRLALKADLDEETAYTICQMISAVGGEIKGYSWDWEWFRDATGFDRGPAWGHD